MALLPEPPRSALLAVVAPDSLTRRARLLAVGSTVKDLVAGRVVLCRPIQGIEVGDALLLPATAILATETE